MERPSDSFETPPVDQPEVDPSETAETLENIADTYRRFMPGVEVVQQDGEIVIREKQS